MERLTITIADETREAVRKFSRRQRRSVSSTVSELVTEQVEKGRKVSPFAALIGAIDDPRLPHAIDMEETLKEIWASAADRDR